MTGTHRLSGNSSQVNERRDEPSAARTLHSCPVPHQAPRTLAAPREALPASLAMGAGLSFPSRPGRGLWPEAQLGLSQPWSPAGPAVLNPGISCPPRRDTVWAGAGRGPGGRRPGPCGTCCPARPLRGPHPSRRNTHRLCLKSSQESSRWVSRSSRSKTRPLPKTLPLTSIGRHSTQSWEEEEQEEGSPPSSSLLCRRQAGGCNAQVPSGTPLWGQQLQAGRGCMALSLSLCGPVPGWRAGGRTIVRPMSGTDRRVC